MGWWPRPSSVGKLSSRSAVLAWTRLGPGGAQGFGREAESGQAGDAQGPGEEASRLGHQSGVSAQESAGSQLGLEAELGLISARKRLGSCCLL